MRLNVMGLTLLSVLLLYGSSIAWAEELAIPQSNNLMDSTDLTPGRGVLYATEFEFIPFLYQVDHSLIAQVFDPPRIPKVGDCVILSIYEINEHEATYMIKMRLHYVPCNPTVVHTPVLPKPPQTKTGITQLNGLTNYYGSSRTWTQTLPNASKCDSDVPISK